jgi:sulfite reductase alpha subunit-like flavoprotein
VNYTVFGCGDRDWAATYQRVPKMIDAEMEAHGARRVCQRGEADASDDFDGQFRGWYEHLWQPLGSALASLYRGKYRTSAGWRGTQRGYECRHWWLSADHRAWRDRCATLSALQDELSQVGT